MATKFLTMAMEEAKELASSIVEYRDSKSTSEGPSIADLEKSVKTSEDSQAKNLWNAYVEARDAVRKHGATMLGVDLDSIGTDEEKDAAKAKRSELTSVLDMLSKSSDPEAQNFANDFEVPNLSGGSSKFGQKVERLRVDVTLTSPDGNVTKFDTLSAFKLAADKKNSGIPKPDIDKIRDTYKAQDEASQKQGVEIEYDKTNNPGWVVTLVKSD